MRSPQPDHRSLWIVHGCCEKVNKNCFRDHTCCRLGIRLRSFRSVSLVFFGTNPCRCKEQTFDKINFLNHVILGILQEKYFGPLNGGCTCWDKDETLHPWPADCSSLRWGENQTFDYRPPILLKIHLVPNKFILTVMTLVQRYWLGYCRKINRTNCQWRSLRH